MAWYQTLPWILAQAAPAEAAADTEWSIPTKLALAALIIASSFALGHFAALRLRMPDYSFKIGLVLFTLIASVVVMIVGWPPKRGIDLSGGVVLIYEVDKGSAQSDAMSKAVAQANDALHALGGEKLEARPISSEQLEIDVPEGVDRTAVERAVADLRTTADLTLRQAGQRAEQGKTVLVYTLAAGQQKAIDMPKLIAAISRRINPGGVKELTIRQYGAEQVEIIIPEVEEREVDQIKKRISTSGLLEFRIVANETDDRDLIKTALKSPARDVYTGGHLAGRWVQAGPDLEPGGAVTRPVKGRGQEILVRIDPYNVTGKYLERARSDFTEGNPSVSFVFNAEGGSKFGQLTSHNLPDSATGFHRRLGIVLDNVMLSAPQINSTIREHGVITGRFTEEEVNFLVGVLNAGSLPASLRPEPISQQRIGSQVGNDTIQKGTMAIIVSTAAILVFMAVYYRFCGIVADIAVTLNMIVTVALMIMIKAAFTLPGLAGMVLTVGMAVDANVLIYERMREETERGASLRMAIRNGFSRAMATIIDSHVTTLVSTAVLYVVGTDQIKGFAVTLIIGLLMSLFTAVFVARVLFDIAEKRRWITQLKMMHVIGHTNIDFIRWRVPAIAGSVIICVLGFIAMASRGQEILDIDFTGGSSVQLLFAEDKPTVVAKVREAVAELPDVAVSSVGDKDLEFKVDTSELDIKKVQKLLQQKFPDSLRTYSMSHGPLSTIEKPKEEKEASAGGPDLTKPEQPSGESPPVVESKKAAESGAKPEAEPESKPAPSAEEPKRETSPAEPAPEAGKPETKPEADSNKQSIHPPKFARPLELAVVGRETALAALALAQNDAAQEAKPAAGATPAAEKPTDKPAESSAPAAATKPAAETKPAEAESQPAAPAQPAAAAPKTPERPDEASEPPPPGSMIGGTRVTLTFPQEISYAPLRDMVQKELDELKLTDAAFEIYNPDYQVGSDARYHEWTLETTLNQEQTTELLNLMQQRLAATPVFPSSNQIGGKVAADTQWIALYALLSSMVIIVVYIWIRFQNVIFGLAAVLALVHDVLVTVAFLAMSSYLSPFLGFLLVDPFKISLPVVAALLTIVGFSINDTIVVFDRIREVRGKSPDLTEDMINLSVNATLSRTLLTSGTVFIASIILYFIGGPGIHAFAYSMVVGVIAGTYSSIYIAAPVLLWMKKPAATATRTGGTFTAGAVSGSK